MYLLKQAFESPLVANLKKTFQVQRYMGAGSVIREGQATVKWSEGSCFTVLTPELCGLHLVTASY